MTDTFVLLYIVVAVDIDDLAQGVLKPFLLVVGPVVLGALAGVFEDSQSPDVSFIWLIFVLME